MLAVCRFGRLEGKSCANDGYVTVIGTKSLQMNDVSIAQEASLDEKLSDLRDQRKLHAFVYGVHVNIY